MEIEERSEGTESKLSPGLQISTKAEPVESEVKPPESAQVKIEDDTKDRVLERIKENSEPDDIEFVPSKIPSHTRVESQSENDSSATCSADEEVDGELERSR